jgi:hypothetical protein
MKSLARFLTVVSMLVLSPHRLPAPIVEIETPTPAPRSAKPPQQAKSKRVQSDSKVSTTATSEQARFTGTWVGKVVAGPPYPIEYTLVINSAGTKVQEKSTVWGSHLYPAIRNGKSIQWETLGHSYWKLTPNSDGRTALVQYLGGASAIFHKTSP